MDNEPQKSRIIPVSIAIAVILIIAGIWYFSHARPVAWTAYHQKTYGFDIKYPGTGWRMTDSLSQETCCLFVYSVDISTTTSKNAGGTTTVIVTAKEPIKIQIGYYYKTDKYDPFDMASTTPVALGKNTAYTGTSDGTLFYLIPTSPLDGIGAAIFTSVENTDAVGTKAIVQKILSTMVFTGTTTDAINAIINPSIATSTAK